MQNLACNKALNWRMNTGEASNTFVKIAACQLPELRGDIDTAIACIHSFAKQAEAEGVQLLCFPECYLQGYLVERELASHYALDISSAEFEHLLTRLPATGPVLVMGMIEKEHGLLYNSAIVVD
jgi:predicted amidohydrolase